MKRENVRKIIGLIVRWTIFVSVLLGIITIGVVIFRKSQFFGIVTVYMILGLRGMFTNSTVTPYRGAGNGSYFAGYDEPPSKMDEHADVDAYRGAGN